MENRKFQVKINKSFSKKYNTDDGTSQGSSIIPLLFLIIINDIKLSNTNVHLSLFADDITIWLETREINNSINVLQQSLKELENWGFRFSVSKTKAMIFAKTKLNNILVLKLTTKIFSMLSSSNFKF